MRLEFRSIIITHDLDEMSLLPDCLSGEFFISHLLSKLDTLELTESRGDVLNGLSGNSGSGQPNIYTI